MKPPLIAHKTFHNNLMTRFVYEDVQMRRASAKRSTLND